MQIREKYFAVISSKEYNSDKPSRHILHKESTEEIFEEYEKMKENRECNLVGILDLDLESLIYPVTDNDEKKVQIEEILWYEYGIISII